MKVDSLNVGVINPLRIRKKRREPKVPPWMSEVPPDSVEVNLRPRSTRYGRTPLRFNMFGTTRTKHDQRLLFFQDHMDKPPPGVLSPEEIRAEIEKLRQERIEGRLKRIEAQSSKVINQESSPEPNLDANALEEADETSSVPPSEIEPEIEVTGSPAQEGSGPSSSEPTLMRILRETIQGMEGTVSS